MNSALSAKCTLWCTRFLALAAVVMIFAFPPIFRWYRTLSPLSEAGVIAVTVCFYLCIPTALYALWCMDRLVTNILCRKVFVRENVSYIRRVRWCCAGVSFLCVIPSCFYQPLILMVVIMAFLALVVSLIKNIMAAAVEIREENDLTI